MRKVVYQLMQDPSVADFMVGGIFGDGALGDPPLLRPFLNLTHEGPFPGIGRMRQWRTTFTVHDDIGDYTRIDDGLKLIRAVMDNAAPFHFDGIWLNAVVWEGDSPDLLDTGRGTNMKYTTYLMTASGL